jgi:hypothetical protein
MNLIQTLESDEEDSPTESNLEPRKIDFDENLLKRRPNRNLSLTPI